MHDTRQLRNPKGSEKKQVFHPLIGMEIATKDAPEQARDRENHHEKPEEILRGMAFAFVHPAQLGAQKGERKTAEGVVASNEVDHGKIIAPLRQKSYPFFPK